jgi:hypothetical protein
MEKAKSLEKVNIPDGKYYGKWSAYYVNVILPEYRDVDVKVNKGDKGINCKCIVEVVDGWLYVE